MTLPVFSTNELTNELTTKNLTSFQQALNGAIVSLYKRRDDQLIVFSSYRDSMSCLSTFLKLHSSIMCDTAIDCIVVDVVKEEYRYNVLYSLHSNMCNTQFRLTTRTNNVLPVASIQSIYPGFNWSEREAWDMFGVAFNDHPDLRRILTDYGFQGHPLKKDFPISGFREISYNDRRKCIEYSPVELTQDIRISNLESPWKN